jgi:hypothetical protein
MKVVSFLILAIIVSIDFSDLTRNKTQNSHRIEATYVEQLLNIQVARRGNQGCCSHHQGVCGCSGGSIVCCDNTFSPSCGC